MRPLLILFSLPLSVFMEIIGLDTPSLKRGDQLKPPSLPLRLIVMRFCPWCERVLLTIAQKNISVEVVNVNLADKPDFLYEKHPEGRVPVLEHDRKNIIDSALIAEYLDWINPDSAILPHDPYLRAKQRMIAASLEAKVPAAVRSLAYERSPSQKATTMKRLHDALAIAEDLLGNNTFYNGNAPGFADYMTYPFMERIWIWSHEEGLTDLRVESFPSDAYPKLQRWFPLMQSRREVMKVSQPLWRHQLFNQGYVNGKPDYDAGLDLRRKQ